MHTITYRVYYEDTDSGGIVYYANYLKFAERARTEMLREKGISQSVLAASSGILFVVRKASLDLLAPARLDDLLEINTTINKMAGSSINMIQKIKCQGKIISEIEVLIVCINRSFRPERIPQEVREALS